MKHTKLNPKLTAEGFNHLVTIADWLAAGGKRSTTIPIDYYWPSCQRCVGGALAYLTGDRFLEQAAFRIGMSENEAMTFFGSTWASQQSPQEMATAIRGWLASGVLPSVGPAW